MTLNFCRITAFNEENEEEAVAGSDDDSVDLNNKLCTFSLTQKEFMNQHWYHCHTCSMVDGEGVCTICAKVCHSGHDLSYSKFGSFFCDCGARSGCQVSSVDKEYLMAYMVSFVASFNHINYLYNSFQAMTKRIKSKFYESMKLKVESSTSSSSIPATVSRLPISAPKQSSKSSQSWTARRRATASVHRKAKRRSKSPALLRPVAYEESSKVNADQNKSNKVQTSCDLSLENSKSYVKSAANYIHELFEFLVSFVDNLSNCHCNQYMNNFSVLK